jgi:hypothetical protein
MDAILWASYRGSQTTSRLLIPYQPPIGVSVGYLAQETLRIRRDEYHAGVECGENHNLPGPLLEIDVLPLALFLFQIVRHATKRLPLYF